MKLGLISDTHGLLRDKAVAALRGCGLIVHAGDIGKLEILDALRAIAPVVAVRGNMDTAPWAKALPLAATAQAGNARLYVIHDVHDLEIDPAAEGFDMVISGHSHKPASASKAGVLYLNPGAAGPRRFRLPITAGTMDLDEMPWTMQLVDVS